MEILMKHFPKDIANMICDMKNHAEHNDRLRMCFVPLQFQVIVRNMQKIDERMFHANQYEYDRVCREEVPDLREAINILATCKCCAVHQTKKPTSVDTMNAYEYRVCCSNRNNINRVITCTCPCRHYARKLIRAHIYDYIDHEEDNRHIIHEVFDSLKSKLQEAFDRLTELKKKKKHWLHQINIAYKEEEYYRDYFKYKEEYYVVLSAIEGQEIIIDELENRYADIRLMLENHIIDFPEIHNQLDTAFMNMFIYPEYNSIYDSDWEMNNNDDDDDDDDDNDDDDDDDDNCSNIQNETHSTSTDTDMDMNMDIDIVNTQTSV
jgi:hypothetical protein